MNNRVTELLKKWLFGVDYMIFFCNSNKNQIRIKVFCDKHARDIWQLAAKRCKVHSEACTKQD